MTVYFNLFATNHVILVRYEDKNIWATIQKSCRQNITSHKLVRAIIAHSSAPPTQINSINKNELFSHKKVVYSNFAIDGKILLIGDL